MQLDVFTFRPDDGPAFELWAPNLMRQVDAPEESVGALVADNEEGFSPNLVVGHDRVAAEMTLEALTARLDADAAALEGARVSGKRTVDGTAGEVRIVAFTREVDAAAEPIYQMTACLLAPESRAGDTEQDLIYLTGTCTAEQALTWDPAFVDIARTIRFG